jgi:hypothetical protein
MTSNLTVTSREVSGGVGLFRCVFTNTSGSVTTNFANVLYYYAASIISQPSDATATEGDTATFTVGVTGNPVDVTWQQSTDGGLSWTDSPNGTTPTLRLSGVTLDQSGEQFQAVVYSPDGNAQYLSTPATLTVLPPS